MPQTTSIASNPGNTAMTSFLSGTGCGPFGVWMRGGKKLIQRGTATMPWEVLEMPCIPEIEKPARSSAVQAVAISFSERLSGLGTFRPDRFV